jgi:hypothetical protein
VGKEVAKERTLEDRAGKDMLERVEVKIQEKAGQGWHENVG